MKRIGILISILTISVVTFAKDVTGINTLLKGCISFLDCTEGYIAVQKNSGWGFLNTENLTFTRCDFQRVQSFSEGYAWVLKNGQWSIMDAQGRVIPTNYSNVKPFSNGLALVTKGTKSVYVSPQGDVVIPNNFEVALSFSEGSAPVCKNGKWGFVNNMGEWILQPKYSEARPFKEGFAAVCSDMGWNFIDTGGHMLSHQHFQSVSDFNEGAAIVHENFSPTMSILSSDSSFVPFYASKIGPFIDGIANYQIANTKTFENGMVVEIPRGKYGYLIHNVNYNPAASVSIENKKERGKKRQQIVNSKYYTVIAPIFDYVQNFAEGYGAVCLKKKWAYVNKNGQYLCLPQLTEAHSFKEGIARVKYDNLYFFIDTLGNGLPKELVLNLDSLNAELQTQNVYCWSQDAQYEQALRESIRLYDLTTKMKDNTIPELSSHELFRASDLILIANKSKNELIAIFEQKLNTASNYYRGIQTPQKMSFQGGSPFLNIENGNCYLQSLIKGKYEFSDELSNYLIRKDYERAAFLLKEEMSLSSNQSSDIWKAYFYLLEISNMSIQVNQNIPLITKYVNVEELEKTRNLENAIWLCELKKFKSATSIFAELIKKEKTDFNKALFYHNWGLACQSYGDFRSSSKYLSKAISIYRNSNDEKSQGLYLEALSSLFACSNVMEVKVMEKFVDEYVNAEINFSSKQLYTNDQRENSKLWEFALRRMSRFLNSLDRNANPKFIFASYIINHFKNCVQLDILSTWQRLLKDNKIDTEIMSLLQEYNQSKELYRGLSPYSPSFTQSEIATADSLYAMEKILKEYIYIKDGDYCSIDKYKRMPPKPKQGDILIDIVEYTDSLGLKQYGAFVFTEKNNNPILIKLFDSKHYGGDGEEYIEENSNSFNFWHPIYSYLSDIEVNSIFLSPGSLSNFGWEYLRDKSSSIPYMLRTNIYRCQSISTTSENKDRNILNTSIALFGDIDYQTDQISAKRGGDDGGGKLVFSKVEIDNIADLLKDKFEIESFANKKGTVRSFLQLDNNSPGIIHLSTHGIQEQIRAEWSKYSAFIQEKDDNILVEELDWLLNSTGLLMTPSEHKGFMEKILKSYQISRCNLTRCDLAVMSACNTSSGKSSEAYAGPMGLNYAFQMASVKNIISTLNDIDDQIASVFMEKFYKNCLVTNDYYVAFRNTVSEIFEDNCEDPEYWSTFIFVNNNKE